MKVPFVFLVTVLPLFCNSQVVLKADNSVKVAKTLPKPISHKHILEALEYAEGEEKLVVVLLYTLGLRISELSGLKIDEISDDRMKTLFTELTVEPIRSDGEVSARYIESIVARLREVGISRAIADLKSNLQRLNPVENPDEYNAAFASLVALETTRRGLHDLAIGSL